MAAMAKSPNVVERVSIHPLVADMGHIVGSVIAIKAWMPVGSAAAFLAKSTVSLPTVPTQFRHILASATNDSELANLNHAKIISFSA